MSQVPGAQRERLIELDTRRVRAAPTIYDKPHFFVSPRTPQGLPTQGFALSLVQATVGAAVGTGGGGSGDGGGGFGVTLWRAIPTTCGWAVLAPFTTAAVYGEQYLLDDISGAWAIYFQITEVLTDGRLLIALAEMD